MTTTRFVPPPDSDAHEPPELRGIARDQVRLLVARPGGVQHLHFADLPDQLRSGDLVVVNTSATLAAALDATLPDGEKVLVHVAVRRGDEAGGGSSRCDGSTAPGPICEPVAVCG